MTNGFSDDIADLFKGLQCLSDVCFPRQCPSCGKVYKDLDAYLSQTKDLRHSSGLMESVDEDRNTIVELYRNCVCGSTMLEFLNDRRDNSQQGKTRRKAFSKVLEMLVEHHGLTADQAGTELRLLLKGRESQVLKKLGINLKRKPTSTP